MITRLLVRRVVSGATAKATGILNNGEINLSRGNDQITGTASSSGATAKATGILNNGEIDLSRGNDQITGMGNGVRNGFAGGGKIALGSGNDQIIGFGDQTVFGGIGMDTAEFRFDLDLVTLSSSAMNSINITTHGVTMSFTDVEQFVFANDSYTLQELIDFA